MVRIMNKLTNKVQKIIDLNRAIKDIESTMSLDSFDGVSSTQVRLLLSLYTYGSLQVTELSEISGVMKESISRIINKSSFRQYVKVVVNPIDHRYKIVSLKAKGRNLLKKIAQANEG